MSEDRGILTTQWDGYVREGPGAATTAVPVIEVGHEGMVLEPEYKRMPIGPDHILYPVLIGLALFPILMGAAGHHMASIASIGSWNSRIASSVLTIRP